MAKDVDEFKAGTHPGYIPSAWEGLRQTVELANEKRIKILINGGGLDPKALAKKTHALVSRRDCLSRLCEALLILVQVAEKNLKLSIAYVDGDNQMHRVGHIIASIRNGAYRHIDEANPDIQLSDKPPEFLDDTKSSSVVCANAYLGFRAIKRGLDEDADIVICGRVSDASPVIAAAAWWHQWSDTDYDRLAGALVAGHLIECSTYVTGANFAGAYQYPVEHFLSLGLPVVEVSVSGECVVTKHEALAGLVTVDTVKCQLLYEIQGNIFLNSDVKADLTNIQVTQESAHRVHVLGVRGYPPPPTTKLAVFYRGGYQCEILVNANGYATDWKCDFQETQLRNKLDEWNLTNKLDLLDFQRVGRPMQDPDCQLASTTYIRIFAQAKEADTLSGLLYAWLYNGMAHFAGS